MLYSIQNQFQNYLLNQNKQIYSAVQGSDPTEIKKRLDIYLNAYNLRLIEILLSDYPKLHYLLGDDDFNAMAQAYIETHPSLYFSARYFGKNLGDFLKNSSTYKKYPFFSEMAKFEWALGETLDAEDRRLFTIKKLQSIPIDSWANLSFELHPSLRVLKLYWNMPQTWLAIEQGKIINKPVRQDDSVSWLLWRKDIQTFFYSISLIELEVLDAIQNNCRLAQICELLLDRLPDQEIQVYLVNLLYKWVDEQIICNAVKNKCRGG